MLLVSALVALAIAIVPGAASAAGSKKLVEGTVYDTTCATACLPECPPPPCGPIRPRANADYICAPQRLQRAYVCPETTTATGPYCDPAKFCANYPVYMGEGAIVHVRKQGSSTVLASLPVVEGHFSIRLGPGRYVLRPYPAEEQCWSGTKTPFDVARSAKSPIQAAVGVTNSCVAHPDTAQ